MNGSMDWLTWVALFGGGALALLGLFKIILSSARLMAWMVLLVVGLAGLGVGLRSHPGILTTLGVPSGAAQSLQELLAPKK